jgi:hypothetical protein
MAKETETSEIVALKKIRMDNEREGVSFRVRRFGFPPLSRITVRSSLISSSAGAVPDHRDTGDQDPQEAPPPERYPTQGDRHLPRYSKLTMLTWN